MRKVKSHRGKNCNYNNLLSKLYYNIKNPSSFKGIHTLYYQAKKINPMINIVDVKNWLMKQDTYTLHHYKINKFRRNLTISKHKDDNWQVD